MSDATPIIIPDNRIEVARSAAKIASDVSSAAKTALGFVKKTWIDDPESGTPITAAELNRIEDAISSLDTSVQDLQDSVSRTGPVTVASGQWGEVVAWAFGPVVTVSARWTSSDQPWQDETVGTLPSGMRPPRELLAPFSRDNVSQACGDVCLRVRADGGVAISGRGGAAHQGDSLQTTLTYIAA